MRLCAEKTRRTQTGRAHTGKTQISMVDIATDPLCREAVDSQASADPESGVGRLVALAGKDRAALVAARDAFARRLHNHSDDYEATGALRLLNRALAAYGWKDPYDWRGRFGHRLIKP